MKQAIQILIPTSLGGGTWERITDGSVLISEGYYEDGALVLPGNSCGSNSHQITIFELPGHTHTYQNVANTETSSAGGGNTGSTALTINQIPSHKHDFEVTGRVLYWDSEQFGIGSLSHDNTNVQYTWGTRTAYTGGSQGHTHTLPSHTHTISTNQSTTGSSGHGNNMSLVQKSICCCRWHRTA